MPILGVPASLGEPEQLSAKSAGGRCGLRLCKLQRDARESGENPLLPRNCKRRSSESRKTTAARREGFWVPGREVRRPVALRMYVFLFRGEGEWLWMFLVLLVHRWLRVHP